MNEEKKNKVIKWALIISAILSGGMLYLFIFYERNVSINEAVATDVVGQYGDFLGGVVGTILSVVLLYYTFGLQREDSKKNARIYELQQLNDKFFKLVEVYNEQLKHLVYKKDDGESCYGKMALHRFLEDIQLRFDETTNYNMRRKRAVEAYFEFYANNRDFAPLYFRTLYRLLEEVGGSGSNVYEEKIKYIKIIRSQFSDSELVFIRYNAMTPMGANFAPYINRYNLLKHLPPLELLEFKEWKSMLTTQQANALNVILLNIKKGLVQMLSGLWVKTINSSAKKYRIDFYHNIDMSLASVTVTRDSTKHLYPGDIFSCLDIFDDDTLVSLMRYYLRELFVLINFNSLNVRRNIIFEHVKNIDNPNKTIIAVRVKNIRNEVLCLTQRQKDMHDFISPYFTSFSQHNLLSDGI